MTKMMMIFIFIFDGRARRGGRAGVRSGPLGCRIGHGGGASRRRSSPPTPPRQWCDVVVVVVVVVVIVVHCRRHALVERERERLWEIVFCIRCVWMLCASWPRIHSKPANVTLNIIIVHRYIHTYIKQTNKKHQTQLYIIIVT